MNYSTLAFASSQFSSIQHFNIAFTPTGACIGLRNVFLMCFSILLRISESVACSTMQRRGVSGAERIYLAQIASLLGLEPAQAEALERDAAAKIDGAQ